jgi:type IV pilus assembly protein PilQ
MMRARLSLVLLFACAGVALAVGIAARAQPQAERRPSAAPTRAQPQGAQEAARRPGDRELEGDRQLDSETIAVTTPHAEFHTVRSQWLPKVDPPLSAGLPQPLHPLESHPPVAHQADGATGLPSELRELLQRALGTTPPGEAIRAPEPRRNGPEVIPPHVGGGTNDAGRSGRSHISNDEGDDSLVIQVQDEDIRTVLDLLGAQGGLNILASKNVQGNVSASLTGVDVETALAAILRSSGFTWRRDGRFLYVGTPADFAEFEQAMDRIATRIYRPNYISAHELEQLITPMLTRGVGQVKATTPPQKGIAPDSTGAGGDDYAGMEAVIVRDYEAVLALVDQVVADVDQRPAQVAIEAVILSVKLDDTFRFGVDFSLLRDQSNIRLSTGSPLGSLGQVDVTNGGFKVGFLDSSLGAFLDALETIGDAQVVATPRLMCLNRQRAEILIGEELGYVSTTQTETATTQSVEFLEVGTQLRIRPFISSDGLVRLEVHPELSSGTVKVEQGFTLPDKEVTKVTTNIMIRDGATVVIGGLIGDRATSTVSQLPIFGNLPVVGPLFRRVTQDTERREILVLITPRIVYEPKAAYEGEMAARGFQHRHRVYAEHLSPIGKRHLARRFCRSAYDAWCEGDCDKALRLAERAVYFDPLRRAAIEMRDDIAAGREPRAPTDLFAAEGEVRNYPLDGMTLPPWLVPEPEGTPTVRHPVDPGQPGSARTLQSKWSFP